MIQSVQWTHFCHAANHIFIVPLNPGFAERDDKLAQLTPSAERPLSSASRPFTGSIFKGS
jgi:hypothetical protein